MPGFYIHKIIMGPKGDHGEPGLPGQPGNKGQKGNAGRDGIDGEPGYSSSISGIIPKSGLKWQLTWLYRWFYWNVVFIISETDFKNLKSQVNVSKYTHCSIWKKCEREHGVDITCIAFWNSRTTTKYYRNSLRKTSAGAFLYRDPGDRREIKVRRETWVKKVWVVTLEYKVRREILGFKEWRVSKGMMGYQEKIPQFQVGRESRVSQDPLDR